MCGLKILKYTPSLARVADKCRKLSHPDTKQILTPQMKPQLSTLIRKIVHWSSINIIPIFQKQGRSRDLYHLLCTCVPFQAIDSRDKIYGLLGLADSSIVPNYDLSTASVFTNFVEHAISQ
jgi:hypothetical protein